MDNKINEEKDINLISLYISDLQSHELLSAEEEFELFKRFREDNDEQAKHLLILSNSFSCSFLVLPLGSSITILEWLMILKIFLSSSIINSKLASGS